MWFFLRRGVAVVLGTITLAQAVVVEVRNPSPRLAGTDHYPTHQGCSGAAFQTGLREVLSPGAIVTGNISSAPRWSDYNAPQPGTVVNVATEHDVQKTVEYCLKCQKPFFAQSGGHGWIGTFHLGHDGVVINMRGLNSMTFNSDLTQAHIGGGATFGEVTESAYAANSQILTGGCNCVGFLGATLGGGYGNLMGLYGFSVDQVLSMNVVLANGTALTVLPSNTDLWWALLGAGANFGVVTSVIVKSYPISQAKNTAWLGGLYFTADKIEQVVQAIQDLALEPKMSIFLYYVTSGAPDYTPTVLATPFYYGTEEEGRAAFSSILNIGPYNDTTTVLPYNKWNAAADFFCAKGERKPSDTAGFQVMDPSTWRSIWNEYTDFLKLPGTGETSILVECYSLKKAQSIDDGSTSFANRDIRFNGVVVPWYTSPKLDYAALTFATRVRDLWRSTAQIGTNRSYINFAFGNEADKVVYNSSLARLSALKKQYDPSNVFNQWFDIH